MEASDIQLILLRLILFATTWLSMGVISGGVKESIVDQLLAFEVYRIYRLVFLLNAFQINLRLADPYYVFK